jgi:sugar lactone lactonase YvrE
MGWTLACTRLMHRTRYRKRAGRATAHAMGVSGTSPPLALVQQVWSPASGRYSWAVSGAIQVIQAELVEVDLGPAEIGEGPVWLADRAELAWVDIERGLIHLLDVAAGQARTIAVGEMVGAIAPTMSGSLVAAVATGFVFPDPTSGRIRRIVDLDPVDPTIRMNDGKADPWGRFWAGTMGLDKRPGAGNLYCLEPGLSVRLAVAGVTISNGLDWTDDRSTMYYVDTPTRRVDRFDLDPTGTRLSNRRPFILVPAALGTPDGLTVDSAGQLWLALWGGSAVRGYSPSGEPTTIIRLPTSHVTSCTFGGPDLADLYITTARSELSAEQLRREPLAGRLFRCRPGAFGRPANQFDDTSPELLGAG